MKCKLLVAEDELIERKVLCRTLQKYLGDLISLYEAKNGREALEFFAREAPQVAVLDIEMPGLTGLEVARTATCGASRAKISRASLPFFASYRQIRSPRYFCKVRHLSLIHIWPVFWTVPRTTSWH